MATAKTFITPTFQPFSIHISKGYLGMYLHGCKTLNENETITYNDLSSLAAVHGASTHRCTRSFQVIVNGPMVCRCLGRPLLNWIDSL